MFLWGAYNYDTTVIIVARLGYKKFGGIWHRQTLLKLHVNFYDIVPVLGGHKKEIRLCGHQGFLQLQWQRYL